MKKQIKKEAKDFSAVQVGVLFESLKNDIGVIAEQHGDVMEKLEGHDKQFDILSKNHLEVVEKLDVLSSDVEVIKEDIRIIKGDLKRKVDIAV